LGQPVEGILKKYYYFFHYHNTHVRELFQAELLDEDFSELGMKRVDVLRPLQSQGIVEDDGEFYIRRDVPPNKVKIMARFNHEQFDGKGVKLAELIEKRIKQSQEYIEKYSFEGY
jgi:hypothetical protein